MRIRTRRSPHAEDRAWRRVLGHPTALKQLLRYFVKGLRSLAEKGDFAKARAERTSFVDASLRGLESDVLWSLPLKGRTRCVIYVLVEHQSAPDRYMAARLLRYVAAVYGHLMDRGARRNGGRPLAGTLPLVLPVVLYCGSAPWSAPMTFEELVERHPGAPHTPISLRYFLVNLRDLQPHRLKHLDSALAGMLLFEKARHTRWDSWVKESLERIDREKDLAFRQFGYMFVCSVTPSVNMPATSRRVRTWLRNASAETSPMVMSYKQLFELEDRLRREEGRREEVQNAVSSLRKLLRRRKINPKPYEKHFAKFAHAGQVADMTAAVATAKDPVAYLKRRFGPKPARARPRRAAARV